MNTAAGHPGRYALYERYPGLRQRLPRLELGHWPTPLVELPGLARAAGLPFPLLAKRDDLSSPVYGGNKVRKLELLLARANAGGRRRMVVTSGGLGSNHVVATAALAGAAGLYTRGLLFCQPVTDTVRRNLLADVALGADLKWVKDYPGVVLGYLRAIGAGLVRDGRWPYILMPGGSNPLSSIGYVNAVFEVADQLRQAGGDEGRDKDPMAIVVPGGTGGTAAGILAGVLLSGLDSTVVAVRVVSPALLPESRIRKLAADTLRLLARLEPAVANELRTKPILEILGRPGAGGRFRLADDQLGWAYGFATDEGRRAVTLAAETEGLKLETTYTGKALAALLARPEWLGSQRDDQARAERPVVFLNTYSSVSPAGIAPGDAPPDLLARLPDQFRWCFERTRLDCRCGLARQVAPFCRVVRSGHGWEWDE